MKIGILTYHRSHNYGAMLQAVALQKVITSLGHDVYFVDYWPKHQSDIYRLWDSYTFKKYNIKGKIAYVKYYLFTLIPKLIRRRHFNRFCKDHILPFCCPVVTEFDVIVYGSDQIWRKQYWGQGYNPIYFGDNDFIAKRHISYAASMGQLPVSKEDIDTVISLVHHLAPISVRESSLKDFLEAHGLLGVKQTLDPTLLLGRQEWEQFVKKKATKKDSYLLLYDLQKGVFDRGQVEAFAKKQDLEVKEIVGEAGKFPSDNYHTVDGPYEFLMDIRNAAFVLTSSFHGLVFSIIFNKPFYVSFRENGGRAESLLARLEITDRLLPLGSFLNSMDETIEWENVNKRLAADAQNSISFIRDTIKA